MTQTGNLKEYTLRVQSFRVNSVGIVLQISDRVLNMIMMVTMLGTIESSWMYNLETSFQEGAMLLQEMKETSIPKAVIVAVLTALRGFCLPISRMM